MHRFSIVLAAAVLAWPAAGAAQVTERTIEVRQGTRLDLAAHEGPITIRTWTRNAVQLHVRHDPTVRIVVDQAGTALKLRSEWSGAPAGKKPPATTWNVTVPRWMDLTLNNVKGKISVEGTSARVRATNVNGGVSVDGGNELVEVSSVGGTVTIRNARGRVSVESVNAGVLAENIVGAIKADAVNGGVRLQGIDSRSINASTVNGAIVYDGTLHRNGVYKLSSHNGRVELAVPAGTNADLKISTFNGSFSASFPVAFDEARRGKTFGFVLGSGGAQIELQTFNGPIRLRRPGGQ